MNENNNQDPHDSHKMKKNKEKYDPRDATKQKEDAKDWRLYQISNAVNRNFSAFFPDF